MNEFWQSLTVGLRRRWQKSAREGFALLGGVWLPTEAALALFESSTVWIRDHRLLYLLLASGAATIWFFVRSYERRSTQFIIPTTTTTLRLKFGDLFTETGNIVVGVNEYFDGELGQLVSPRSVHGLFLSKIYNSDARRFRTDVEAALSNVPTVPVSRTSGAGLQYPIGTTAVLHCGTQKCFLLAMARTDLAANNKAVSDIPTLWTALSQGLEVIRNNSNGEPFSLPLMGNGHSGINVAPQYLLRLVVLAIVDFARKRGLPPEVTLVLHESCFSTLDIHEICQDWSNAA